MPTRRRRIDSPPEDATAQLVVRRIAPEIKELLRLRAKHNSRSLEAEIREILHAAAMQSLRAPGPE
jgi:plasmid stability protein